MTLISKRSRDAFFTRSTGEGPAYGGWLAYRELSLDMTAGIRFRRLRPANDERVAGQEHHDIQHDPYPVDHFNAPGPDNTQPSNVT